MCKGVSQGGTVNVWIMYRIFTGEKELKPISGRVKEIAEFVLTCIMEKVVS